MPRDSTTLTFVIVGEETPIYECEIKAGPKVRLRLRCGAFAGLRDRSRH